MTSSSTTAVLTVDEFREGEDLPQICVITGAEAERLYAFTAVATSDASLFDRAQALMAGPLSSVTLDAASHRVNGWLPMSARAKKRLTWLRWARVALLVALILTAISLAATGSNASGAATAALLVFVVGIPVVAAFMVYVSRQEVGLQLRGPVVNLRRVHPEFAHAVANRD